MDKQTAGALEQRLAQRAEACGAAPERTVPGAAQPLYVKDLEERARWQGLTVDELYEHDQQLVSRPRLTTECLRADEVMQAALTTQEMPHRAWKHYQECGYCQGLVAMSRPDAARHQEFVAQLAEAETNGAPVVAPIVQWTDALFAKLDRGVPWTVKNGAIVVGCFLLGFYFSLNWVRQDRTMVSSSNDKEAGVPVGVMVEMNGSQERSNQQLLQDEREYHKEAVVKDEEDTLTVKKGKKGGIKLPTYFGHIGLSKKVEEDIRKAALPFDEKIAELQRQIQEQEAAKVAACESVLIEHQKSALKARREDADKASARD